MEKQNGLNPLSQTAMFNAAESPRVSHTGEIEDPGVRKTLLRIVVRLEHNPSSREDLMQEALVHFWMEVQRNPGHSLSWYLQNCRFYLQHFNARGRSVDSPKRARNGTSIQMESSERNEPFETAGYEADILSEVSAREIISLLSSRLRPRQQAILNCLAVGLGTCEIARLLRVSHPAVIKNRRKIATLATKLGFAA